MMAKLHRRMTFLDQSSTHLYADELRQADSLLRPPAAIKIFT